MMTKRHNVRTTKFLSGAAILALCAGAASAQIQPIGSPHGTISGTIDGYAFDLPVRCET